MSRIAFWLAVLLASAPWARAQVTVLDPGAGVSSSAVTIGGDGLALIAYRAQGALKVAHCEQAACTTAALATLDSSSTGNVVAIATGADGLGLIAYQDAATNVVRVAHCGDPACTSAQSSSIATGVPDAIAVGADGLGLVSYRAPAVKLAHCLDAACSGADLVTLPDCSPIEFSSVTTGGDGLGLVICGGNAAVYGEGHVAAIHCNDPACSAPNFVVPLTGTGGLLSEPRLIAGSDGLGFFTIDSYSILMHVGAAILVHCEDAACTSVSESYSDPPANTLAAPAVGADGLPLIVVQTGYLVPHEVLVSHCLDVACASQVIVSTDIPLGVQGATVGTDAMPLITLDLMGTLAVAHCLNPTCDPMRADLSTSLSDGITTAVPGQPLTYTITVSNAGPSGAPGARVTDTLPSALVNVAWTCVASPGSSCPASGSGSIDHVVDVAAGGTLTYALTATVDGAAAGSLSNTASASVSPPYTDPTATNNSATDTDALDVPLAVSVANTSVAEGTGTASFSVTLSRGSVQSVTVDWATTPGTATANADYMPASGAVTFSPGVTAQSIGVAVVGDHVLEPAEDFGLQLSAPSHAVLGVSQATCTILDDDAPHNELVQGSDQIASLAAWPGPLEDREYYLIGTPVHSSWEVVVDSTSADVVPIVVERLDSDTLATLQTAIPVAGGSSVSLRWENSGGAPGARASSGMGAPHELLSVRSGGCTVDCGAGAAYHIRARETTCAIPRFNNTGTQVTLLVMQNTSDAPVHGTLWFWSTGGSLLASQAFLLGPRGQATLNTVSLGLAGQEGSLTLAHDGPFGSLAGKAVSLEPAAGFTFDTPMTPRAH